MSCAKVVMCKGGRQWQQQGKLHRMKREGVMRVTRDRRRRRMVSGGRGGVRHLCVSMLWTIRRCGGAFRV